MPAPLLTGIGTLLSGAGLFGGLFGESDAEKQERLQKKQWEREDARNAAASKYLQGMGEFTAPNFQFNQENYRDVLDPMQEQYGRANTQLRNTMSLQGMGRGGQMPELMARQGRDQSRDFNNMLSKLAREGGETAYRRALETYGTNLDRKQGIARYMGA